MSLSLTNSSNNITDKFFFTNSTTFSESNHLIILCTPYLSPSLLSSPFLNWSLVLQPYWLTFVSTLAFLVLSFIWNVALAPLLRTCFRCIYLRTNRFDDCFNEWDDNRLFFWRFTPSSKFMLFMYLLQFLHLVYITCTLTPDQTVWERYTELYARLINGGFLTVPFALLRTIASAKIEDLDEDCYHDFLIAGRIKVLKDGYKVFLLGFLPILPII